MFGPSKHFGASASALPDYITKSKPSGIRAPQGQGFFGRFRGFNPLRFENMDDYGSGGAIYALGAALSGAGTGDPGLTAQLMQGRRAQVMQSRDRELREAAAGGDMTALGRLDPFAAARLKREMESDQKSDRRWKQTQAWGRQDRADDLTHRDRIFDAGRDDRASDVAHRDRTFDHTVTQDGIRNNQWDQSFNRGILESDRSHDLAADQFGHRKNVDYANIGIANSQLDIAKLKANQANSPYSAGEIKSMREKGEQLTAFQNSLDTYLKAIETQGVQAWDIGGRNKKAASLDAMRQDLLFQGKNLWELGVLSKDDYENMEKAIPDATGVGVAIAGKGVALQKARPLKDSIDYQLGRIPEEYRSYVPPSAPTAAPNMPAPGTIENGYRYLGGNPADPNSWELVS